MPIITSNIVKNHNRGNRSRVVYEQHIDHNNDVYDHKYYCSIDHDTGQSLLDWASRLNISLVSDEKEYIQKAIEEGADPATLATKHISTEQKARRVIKALMIGSPEKMLKAAEYVQGFSNTQIERFFTTNQRIRIRTRQKYIINNQSVYSADIREEI